MRFRGLMDCDKRFTSAHQVAILHYTGANVDAYPTNETNYENSHKQGMVSVSMHSKSKSYLFVLFNCSN